MSLCMISAVWGGYFARLIWACTQLYHSSTLLDPWLKLVSKSNLAHTSLDWGLQNSSNWDQIVSNSNSSLVKPHDMYWPIPKSPLQAINFLHCWSSGRAASSHSCIFSHFSFNFKKPWYKLSFTVQFFWVPLYMAWTFVAWLDWLLVACLGEMIFHYLTHS